MPKINTAYAFDVALVGQADTRLLQANPTLAAGDVKVSIDEGAFANITTLPTIAPSSGRNVKVALTAAEMNGNRIVVQFVDASGAEWCDLVYSIETSPDDLTVTAIRTGLGLASANLDTQLDALPTATESADALLARDIGSGSAAGALNERTVRAALRWNRNRITVVGTTMTVYKEDDTTVAWTGTVSGGLAVALGMDAT